MDIKEILDIIWELNCEAYDYFGEDLFTAKTDGNTILINFLGVCIWNSDDDMREYTEEDEYEPLSKYITREAHKIIRKLNSVKKYVFE